MEPPQVNGSFCWWNINVDLMIKCCSGGGKIDPEEVKKSQVELNFPLPVGSVCRLVLVNSGILVSISETKCSGMVMNNR